MTSTKPPPAIVGAARNARALRLPSIALVLAGGLALRLAIAYVWFPGEGLHSDLRLYALWAETLERHGVGGFYANAGFADYPPGYLWVLWLIGEIGTALAGPFGVQPVDVIRASIKLPAIGADMAIGALLYGAARRRYDRQAGIAAAALFLFVPVTWYDSALWGQVDAIGALLLLAAVLLLVRGWSEPAVAMAVVATVTKPQFAIGLIVIGAVLLRRHLLAAGSGPVPDLPAAWTHRAPRFRSWLTVEQGPGRLVSCAAVGLLVGLAVIVPFDLESKAPTELAQIPIVASVAGLLAVVGSAADFYNVLTVNAFNWWAFVGPQPLTGALDGTLTWTFDSLPVVGPITAAQLGAAMFLLVTAIVVVTLVLRDDEDTLVISLTLMAVAFFAVPTRVHERYLFPAFAIGALLALRSSRWRWWYLALAIANVANLHAILTLPFEGYATPGLRDLPLGALLREPVVVGLIADVHIALFVVLMAYFVRRVTLPVIAEARAGPGSFTPTHRTGARRLIARIGRVSGTAPTFLPVEPDAVEQPAPDDPARLDRRAVLIALAVIALVLVTRIYRLETPRTMYFDERWHATAAAEFLQGWRYGLPAELSEVTHPHLAKYLIAAGLAVAGGDRVTGTGSLGATVEDVAFEPAYRDPSAGVAGDRIIAATGTGLTVVARGALSEPVSVPVPGARAVAVDTVGHSLLVGTTDGLVLTVPSRELAATASGPSAPALTTVGQVPGGVRRMWIVEPGRVAVLDSTDRLSMLDVPTASTIASIRVPGLRDVVPVGPVGSGQAVLALPSGLVRVDVTTMSQLDAASIGGGAVAAVLVEGSEQGRRDRNLLGAPTLYVLSGAARVSTYEVAPDGALSPREDFPLPGAGSDIAWDRPTNLLHVLGKAPDGSSTIYVVEPHGNVVFADAKLPFEPRAWILDVHPDDPANDRQRAIAFGPDGDFATVDVGSHAFAWRLPGVLAGALTAGMLYLLARILFGNRTIALLFGAMLILDGLLFQQARIAMNDVYAALFVIAALTLLAYLLGSRAVGKRATLEALVGLPAVGVLLGLGLASKWVAAYAIGAAILLILLRSVIGRYVALVGMVLSTGVFGYLAIAREPANIVFLLLMLALTGILSIAIARARGDPLANSGPIWTQPTARRGALFCWAMFATTVIPLVVYVLTFIPWAVSTAGGPQLFPGWPPGHSGQTFMELQASMYRYHDEFRFPHGAGSPWWAWPLDLKPIWGYLENFADGSQATVLGAGNPFLAWLSIAAVAIGAWLAWRRRSRSLGFVVIVFLAIWLPWARIDRVTFNYHYHLALPFALLLLAYVVAELLDRPSPRVLALARTAALASMALPVVLWVLKGPLCTVAGVDRMDPGSSVCSMPLTEVAPGLVAYGAIAALVAAAGISRGSPRRLVVTMGIVVIATSVALYPALSAVPLPSGSAWAYQSLLPSWDSSFRFWSNPAAAADVRLFTIGAAAVLGSTALVAVVGVRSARGRRSSPRSLAWRGLGSTRLAMATAPAPTAIPSGSLTVARVIGGGESRRAPSSAVAGGRRVSVAAPARGVRAWSAPRLLGTALGLLAISLPAALLADRFRGFGGPWLWNFDMPLANYPFAVYFHEALTNGGLPLWQDRIGMGFPLYAEGQIGAFYPPNWLIFQLPPLIALDVARIVHLIMAGVGAGLITLRLTGSRTGAIATALVAVLCGGIVSKLEWTQVVTVYGWMPWVVLPVVWRRPAPTRGLVALSGVLWGVQALGGHPPYWVLTGLVVAITLLVQDPGRRALGRLALFVVAGAAIGAVQLIPTAILTTLSWRAEGVGSAALFEYSATPFDILAIAFGNAFMPATGDAVDLRQSWYPGGSVWATLEVYAFIGLPALFFAVVGLGTRRGRLLAVLAAAMIAIPIIGVFRPELWAAIPGLNGLRHPIRAYLVLDLVLAVAAGIGIARIGRGGRHRLALVVVIAAVAAYAFVTALVTLAPAAFDALVPTLYPYLAPGQAETVRRMAVDALTPLFPIAVEVAVAGGAVLLLRDRNRYVTARFIAIGLVALPLAVLSPAINQSQPSSSFSLEGTSLLGTVRSLAPRQLLTIDEPFYGGFPSQLAGVGEQEPHVYTSQFGLSLRLESAERLIEDLRVAGLTSAYARAVGVDSVVSFSGSCPGESVAVDAATGAAICQDPLALRPPYWLPSRAVITVVEGSGPFGPGTALVDPAGVLSASSQAAVRSRDRSRYTVDIDAPAEGYVFVDRTWWPWWQVTVDGRPVTSLSGLGGHLVPVSAGRHVIEERLVPWDALVGLAIGVATALGLAIWASRAGLAAKRTMSGRDRSFRRCRRRYG